MVHLTKMNNETKKRWISKTKTHWIKSSKLLIFTIFRGQTNQELVISIDQDVVGITKL